MLLIVVSPHHCSPTALKVKLGTHTLLITSESTTSDNARPVLGTAGMSTEAPVIFDNEEAYQLYLCLHVLFHQAEP